MKMQNQNKDKENRYPEYEAPENGMQPRQHTGRPPEERDPHRRQHLPAVRIAAQRKRAPVFDTHYFLTAMTHIFVALASLGFAAYMVVQLAGNLTTTVTTSAAIKISEPEYEAADAYLLRDEKVLTANASGSILPAAADGTRLATNETAASIYPSGDEEINKSISDIDREIKLLEAAAKRNAWTENMREVYRSLADRYSDIMSSLSVGDYVGASGESDELRRLMIRYDIYRGKNTGIDDAISALKTKKATLEAQRGNVIGTVKASDTGYYFRYCDGYEALLGAELINNFTCEGFYGAIGSSPATAENSAGKIARGVRWYIATAVDRSNDTSYTEGSTYNVMFNDNGGAVLAMRLDKKVADTVNGGTLLLFSTDLMPESFTYYRRMSVKLEKSVLDGYRVPMSAVRSYRGMTGVYTLHGGRVYFRRINILNQNDDYCIVSEYSEVGNDRQLTYRILGFNSEGVLGEYDSLHRFAKQKGWQRRIYDNGGTPVKYGTKEDYYFYLDELEDIILTGRNLYDGKTLS